MASLLAAHAGELSTHSSGSSSSLSMNVPSSLSISAMSSLPAASSELNTATCLLSSSAAATGLCPSHSESISLSTLSSTSSVPASTQCSPSASNSLFSPPNSSSSSSASSSSSSSPSPSSPSSESSSFSASSTSSSSSPPMVHASPAKALAPSRSSQQKINDLTLARTEEAEFGWTLEMSGRNCVVDGVEYETIGAMTRSRPGKANLEKIMFRSVVMAAVSVLAATKDREYSQVVVSYLGKAKAPLGMHDGIPERIRLLVFSPVDAKAASHLVPIWAVSSVFDELSSVTNEDCAAVYHAWRSKPNTRMTRSKANLKSPLPETSGTTKRDNNTRMPPSSPAKRTHPLSPPPSPPPPKARNTRAEKAANTRAQKAAEKKAIASAAAAEREKTSLKQALQNAELATKQAQAAEKASQLKFQTLETKMHEDKAALERDMERSRDQMRLAMQNQELQFQSTLRSLSASSSSVMTSSQTEALLQRHFSSTQPHQSWTSQTPADSPPPCHPQLPPAFVPLPSSLAALSHFPFPFALPHPQPSSSQMFPFFAPSQLLPSAPSHSPLTSSPPHFLPSVVPSAGSLSVDEILLRSLRRELHSVQEHAKFEQLQHDLWQLKR